MFRRGTSEDPAWLSANNASRGIQRDPNDNWGSNSSILEKTEGDLLTEHVWERLPMTLYPPDTQYHKALRLRSGWPRPFVFDTIGVASGYMDAAEKDVLRQKVNQIFELRLPLADVGRPRIDATAIPQRAI